jgi:hypothetical protein
MRRASGRGEARAGVEPPFRVATSRVPLAETGCRATRPTSAEGCWRTRRSSVSQRGVVAPARISNAAEGGDYPFTTLEPALGTVEAPDGRQLVVADVPGLIEGAAEGAGLGHEFLAHLERARMLVHVVDGAAGDLAEHYATIRAELASYGAGLDELPRYAQQARPAFEPPELAPAECWRVSACATGAGSASAALSHSSRRCPRSLRSGARGPRLPPKPGATVPHPPHRSRLPVAGTLRAGELEEALRLPVHVGREVESATTLEYH